MYIHVLHVHVCCLLTMCAQLRACREQIRTILSDSTHMKMSRDNALFALLDTVMEQLSSDSSMTAHPSLVSSTFWSVCGQELQRCALEDGLRSGKRERRGRERGCERGCE